jgi:hypothetical protein
MQKNRRRKSHAWAPLTVQRFQSFPVNSITTRRILTFYVHNQRGTIDKNSHQYSKVSEDTNSKLSIFRTPKVAL